MRILKNAGLALLMLLLASFAFANGDQEGGEAGDSVGMEEFSGALTMWTGNVDPGLESLAEIFNEEHDFDLVINVVPFRDYAQKVIAASRTGELPDMFDLQPRQPAAWGELGYLTPVTELVEELGGTDVFSEQDLYFNTLNGEVWGIPFFTIPHVLFYREDLLAEAGFDDAPQTWQEFEEASRALTEGDRFGYVAFMNDPSVGHLLHQWMAARGAETFGPDMELTINSEETKDVLRFLAGLFNEDLMYEGSVAYGMGDARVFFVNDRAGMITTSTSFARSFADEPIRDNIAVAEIPKNGGDANYYAMRSLGISAEPQSLEATEYVMDWIYQTDNYLQYFSFKEAKLGFIPAHQGIIDDGSYWNLEYIAPLRDILEPAMAVGANGWYPGMKYEVNQFVALFDAQNIYQDMLLKVVVDGWTADEAAEWAEEQMQEILDRM